jgi:DNA-binding MarR family transcriptional regulator
VQVPKRALSPPVDVATLPISYLAQFVGGFANRHVLGEMQGAGYGDLRESHGYLIQHLLREPHSVGQLAKLLGVSQQAVSKAVAELTRGGYLESEPGEDARVRLVRLSERGLSAVAAGRRIRDKLERRLSGRLGEKRAAVLRTGLAELLQELGGTELVKARRVPMGDTGT